MFLWAEVTVSALGNWVGSGAAELLGLLTIYGMVSFSRSTVMSKRLASSASALKIRAVFVINSKVCSEKQHSSTFLQSLPGTSPHRLPVPT